MYGWLVVCQCSGDRSMNVIAMDLRKQGMCLLWISRNRECVRCQGQKRRSRGWNGHCLTGSLTDRSGSLHLLVLNDRAAGGPASLGMDGRPAGWPAQSLPAYVRCYGDDDVLAARDMLQERRWLYLESIDLYVLCWCLRRCTVASAV